MNEEHENINYSEHLDDIKRDDPVEESKKEPSVLPEAPASASVKIKSANGFEYIFTIRDEKASVLMFKIAAMEKKWLSLGWQPLAQQQGFQRKEAKPVEYVQGKQCPQCGKRLIKGVSKDGTKHFEKCEDNRYNWQTKQQEGCSFINWL